MTSQPQLRLAVRKAGVLVYDQEVSPLQCSEDACFRAVIAGQLGNDGRRPQVTLTPVWLPEGEPGVAQLVVRLAGVDQDFVYAATEVFADLAATVIARLISDKTVESRAELAWRIEAVARSHQPPPSRFGVRVVHRPYPLTAGALGAQARGTMSVRIEAAVIEKGRAEVINNPEQEVAGLLVGRIVHDAGQGIAEVVAQDYIPMAAGERGASRAHFAFGPNTFAEARATLQQGRCDGEGALVSVGWLHTHPPCERCFSKTDCPAHTVFFSQDDVRVHASAFAAPFNIALVWGKVANAPASRPGFRIYCWYRGRVVEVDYSGLDAKQPAVATPRATAA